MLERNITVGQVAAALPKAMDYFDKLGIDYCCGGNRLLTDAIDEAELSQSDVFTHLNELEKKAELQGERQDFKTMSKKELTDYIVDTHHAFLFSNMPEITQLLGAVMRAHGAQHPELFKLGQLFSRLRGDLEQHLLREEMFLFPALNAANNDADAAKLTPEIIAEHEDAGKMLEELRTITNGYTVPNDACASYEKLYKLLAETQNDLHRHIHLENNILLKEYDIR